ncbi:hypothetical protein TNCV_2515481 [Trichonephila clavipes]|nr:hypothetical protein TNCV_2515481 [Trichonephila clavipes]
MSCKVVGRGEEIWKDNITNPNVFFLKFEMEMIPHLLSGAQNYCSKPDYTIAYQLLHLSINLPVTNRVAKNEMPPRFYRQHVALFPLNRHYNVRNALAYEYYNFNIK